MLSKADKKFIVETVDGAIVRNNDVLVKEILALFSITNSRIDEVVDSLGDTNERIEQVNNNLSNKIDQVNVSLGKRIDETNERIEQVNNNLSNKMDRVLDKLEENDESLNGHDKRIGKLEEKALLMSV